ncbi:hypothetical protein CYL21_2807 [Plasmodium falciparum NF54]|uniref:Uncharacterized protein n=2 Tax=Plasmodium falciparum TaxID=5833 RepID=Q8IM72_PLAF7|nr:conserved Plasmodium protein, unknown function [Plasmodium falciparum 3D7]EWC86117.1 hypothetical protein PFNF54_04848 [Plasmodium falciparum NF54]KAF4329614.1 hypothetical protein CYL21_2807 [Plasmodium falciparum NF54]PKC49377.1 hypothetical protein CK202_0075 [Plasmodium falciparum NF54]CZT99723.1 conserved Plasmodium protein, unknown function [Plasmodium falciparum 3D7]|eukprot:XP_001348192.1 Plasmodium exported protein, unknown function [Plasmodium falciparum 3D7]
MYVIKIYHIIIFYVCLHNFLKTSLNIDYEKDVECSLYLINKTNYNKFYIKEKRELGERESSQYLQNLQNLQNSPNLQNLHISKFSRKRTFDSSLTLDELYELKNIIFFERRILDDLVVDVQNSIDDGKHIIFLKDFVKNKMRLHIRLYGLNYSFNGINNMGNNLLNQMEEINSNFPLTHESVNIMYISYKTELDISMDLLDCVLRQRDEQKRNEYLCNMNDIRLTIYVRFNSEGINIKEEIINKMIIRIKARIHHIIIYHENLPSYRYRH